MPTAVHAHAPVYGVVSLRVMPGEGSQESPGQQRRARWDPLADTEDRLALQRLTQKAAALSSHPSPTKVIPACPCVAPRMFHGTDQILMCYDEGCISGQRRLTP